MFELIKNNIIPKKYGVNAMHKKLVGFALLFFGMGILTAKYFSGWNIVAAFIFIAAGVLIALNKY